jgi:DNA-binding XRE family transcriptional regulator
MTHPRNAQPSGADADKAAFLRDLRALRDQAGLQTRDLAARAHYPEDTLITAEAGPALPSLPVLEAYVRGCGARPADWEERWRRLMSMPAEELGSALPTRAPVANRPPTRAESAGPIGLSAAEQAALAPGLARVAAGLGPTTVAADTGSWFSRPEVTAAESAAGPAASSGAVPAAPDSGADWRTPDHGAVRPFTDGRAGRRSPEGETAWPPAERAPAWPAADSGTAWPAADSGPAWPAAADRAPAWPAAQPGTSRPPAGAPQSAAPRPLVPDNPAWGNPAPQRGGPPPGAGGPATTERGTAAAGASGGRSRTGKSTAPLSASGRPAGSPSGSRRPAGRAMAGVVLSLAAILVVAALLWLALKP